MVQNKLAIVISHCIQHFIPQYSNWVKNEGWEIKVFFGNKAGTEEYFDPQFNKMIKWNSANLNNFPHEFLSNDLNPPSKNNYSKNLESSLSEYRPNFVLIYGYSQELQRQAKKWALKNNVKLLYFADSELRHDRSFLTKIIKKVFLPSFYKNISYFLTTGNANEEYLSHYKVPTSKFIRSSYPIDIELYKDKKSKLIFTREKMRNSHDVSSDTVVLCMVGKYVKWKRQIDIIKAMVLLDNISHFKLKLILIGTGVEENNLKKESMNLKNHSVEFKGFIIPEELPDYYALSDIYVHASEIEPHSVAISEAIFMGCPILISDKCGSYGTDDDVQNGINGFIYKCGDIKKLSDLILKLSYNEKLRNSMSVNSHNIAIKNQMKSHFTTIKTLEILQ